MKKPPVAPWIPPQAPRPPRQVVYVRDRQPPPWRGAWLSGLWAAFLPLANLFFLGTVRHQAKQGSWSEDHPLVVFAEVAGHILLMLTAFFCLVAFICAIVVMVKGAFFRGMLIVILAMPIWFLQLLTMRPQ